MTYRVVGIDFSFTGTGLARFEDGHDIVTARRGWKETTGLSLAQRLDRTRKIVRQIVNFALDGYDDDGTGPMPLFVIEAPSYGSTGGQSHERSGAWWLIVHLLSKHGPVVEIAPTTVKSYICSNGSAKKPEVMAAVTYALNLYVDDNNVADALALAAMGRRQMGRPVEVRTSKLRPTALDAVRWPTTIERK